MTMLALLTLAVAVVALVGAALALAAVRRCAAIADHALTVALRTVKPSDRARLDPRERTHTR